MAIKHKKNSSGLAKGIKLHKTAFYYASTSILSLLFTLGILVAISKLL